MDIDGFVDERYPDDNLLRADGFDDCALGVVERCGQKPYLVYDPNKIIAQLVKENDMDQDEAREYFDFNIAGAWVGDGTPGFLDLLD